MIIHHDVFGMLDVMYLCSTQNPQPLYSVASVCHIRENHHKKVVQVSWREVDSSSSSKMVQW